jgi:hypothetical protein
MNHGAAPIFSRRRALQTTAAGFGHLALAGLMAEQARAAGAASGGDVLAAKAPKVPARAKRIVFLFMKGGPSAVDTFDPKPLLDRDDGKKYPFQEPRIKFAETGALLKSPWKFKRYGQSGLPVSELFPNVAECADELCVIRSLHGTNPAHGGALLKLHTGSDTQVRPSMGSWVLYGLGTENQNLPGFITICPTLAHGGVNNWGSAFLPAHCQGTPIGNAAVPSDQAVVRHIRNGKLTPEAQREQLDLLAAMNREHLAAAGPNQDLEGRINSFELAFRMQMAMPEAQDVGGETDATRRLYGMDDPVTANFGRQCLMARRFLERGVRFVQVTHSDGEVQWDQHGNLYKGHGKNAAEVDKPIAGLLRDLRSRGLLEDTLVLWGGEFGRTPTAQGKDGRDHNPHGFTMFLAGGGVKAGFAYGATDDYGYYAQQDKVHIHDLHATLLAFLGVDHERLTHRYSGRDFRLTDVDGHVVQKIFA